MAQQQQQQRDNGPNGDSKTPIFYWVLAAVAVVGITVPTYNFASSAFSSAVSEPVELEYENDQELVEMAQGVVLGDAEAPATIVEFGDYQCPGCGSFAQRVKPRIDSELIEAGRANFVFYDFPLVQIHDNAFLAARAARCAGDQDGYWAYHDELFRNQAAWASEGNPVGTFVDYAGEVGLDRDAFESCLKSDRYAETVTANMQLAEALGVSGTPTVMVSTGQGMAERLPNYDFNAIEAAVNEVAGPDEQGDG